VLLTIFPLKSTFFVLVLSCFVKIIDNSIKNNQNVVGALSVIAAYKKN